MREKQQGMKWGWERVGLEKSEKTGTGAESWEMQCLH